MKIKTRNLLAVILSVLCAVLLAVGVSFVLPKNEVKTAHAAGGELIKANGAVDLNEAKALAQAAGYTDFGAMYQALESGASISGSGFHDYVVTVGGKNWYAVYASGTELTLLYVGEAYSSTWSDGTYSHDNLTINSNVYEYSYIRSCLNAGATQYLGGFPNYKTYNGDQKAPNAAVAPNTHTEFVDFLPGGQFSKYIIAGPLGDSVWLPGTGELGTWGATTTQLSSSKWMWLRDPHATTRGHALSLGSDGSIRVAGDNVFTIESIRPAIIVDISQFCIEEPTDVTVTYNGNPQTLANVAAEDKEWYDSAKMTLDYVDAPMTDKGTYKVKATLTQDLIDQEMKFLGTPDTSKGETDYIRYFEFKIDPKPLNATLTETDGNVTLTVDQSGLCGSDSMPTTAIQYTSTDGNGYNSTTAPAQKGSFKAEATITDTNSNYSLNCTPASVTYTINAIKVDLPALPPTAVPEYDGTSQTITLSNYTHDGKGVNIFSVSGKTASNASVATASTFDTANGTVTFKDAGTYTVTFTLEDTVNCVWKSDSSTGQKNITFTVKPKQLTVAVTNNNGGLWNWGIGTAVDATVTVSDIISGDNVKLTTSYTASTGVSVSSTGTANGGATSVGDTISLPANLVQDTYTLSAQIDNENYSISDGLIAASMPLSFTIGAAVFDPDAFTWTYSENGTGSTAIADGDNFLKYKLDAAGKPYEYKLSINLGSFVSVFRTLTDSDYTNHKQTDADTYTTTVRLTIKDSNYSFDTTKIYTNATIISTTVADVVIHWTIQKGDFTDLDTLPWVYRDGTSGSWVDYNPAKPPEYSGKTITVKLKGDVDGTLRGLKPAYGAHDAEKEISPYVLNVSFSVTDTKNFNVPAGITFNWEITKKQINIQWEPDVALTYSGTKYPEWNGNEYYATQLRYDKPEFADKVDYIYSCTLPDGSTYSGRGVEALAYITEQALAASQKIAVEVEVELKSDATIQKSYELNDTTGGGYKTTFMVGDNKIVAKVELTTSGEYSEFNYNLTVTGEDMDSGKYTATVYKGTNISDPDDPANTKIDNFDPKTADAGEYFVVVALTGDWDNEYRLSGRIKTFEILPKSVDLPVIGNIVFSGKDINLVDYMTGFDANLMEFVAGGDFEGLRNVSENGYVAQLKLKDSNYRWKYDDSKSTAKFGLCDYEINKFDDTTAVYKWNIAPLVVDTTNMWSKGKNGATLNLPKNVKDLIAGGTLEVGYRYYDTEGNFIETPEIKGNNQFKVEAVFGGDDAVRNVQFKTGDTTLGNTSPAINYTVPQSGIAAFGGKVLSFLKNYWWWILIALAILILLIILIVVIAKRRKNKEEREEKKRQKEEEKERKEEEKRRREEEREAERERQKHELELAKAKQEAELAKMKAEAAAAAGIGAAGMAVAAQPQQPVAQAQPAQAPVQQVIDNTNNELLKEMREQMAELRAENRALQQQKQQPVQQPVAQIQQPTVDPNALAKLEAEMAAMRAENKAMHQSMQQQQQMPVPMAQPMVMPMQQPMMQMPMQMQQPMMPMMQQPSYGPMPSYGGNGGSADNGALARVEAQLNALQAQQRAKDEAEHRAEMSAMRAEMKATKEAEQTAEFAALRNQMLYGNSGNTAQPALNAIPVIQAQPQQANNNPNSMDMLGALVVAALKNIAEPKTNESKVVEQRIVEAEPPVAVNTPTVYPPDAVVTTTTRVDTTKPQPQQTRNRDDGRLFDVDGFYDSFEGNK